MSQAGFWDMTNSGSSPKSYSEPNDSPIPQYEAPSAPSQQPSDAFARRDTWMFN